MHHDAVCAQASSHPLLAVHRYQAPTAIQAQGLPAALSGRDVLVMPQSIWSVHTMLVMAMQSACSMSICGQPHSSLDLVVMVSVPAIGRTAGYQDSRAGSDQQPEVEAGSHLSGAVQGLAVTGSGKTAAFVLPLVVHIMDQPELAKGEGPIGLICAPTRELGEQIHKVCSSSCERGPFLLVASATQFRLKQHDFCRSDGMPAPTAQVQSCVCASPAVLL